MILKEGTFVEPITKRYVEPITKRLLWVETAAAYGKNVVAVIPAYDEERFIGSVVLRVRKYASTVIVVDDGSSDGTAEVAAAAGAMVIKHEQNRGYGAAIDTAFSRARQLEPDALILIDADGQHIPEQVPDLVEPILAGRADMVVGSRYIEKRCHVPFLVQKAHTLITGISNVGSGVRISDSQCGFRAFSWRAVGEVQLAAAGMAAASEFQFLASHFGWRVEEVPVTILYDENDPKKRSRILQGFEVINGIIRQIGQAKPLLFFGIPGMAALCAGIAWGIRVVSIYHKTHSLAIGNTMISVLLILLGILGLFAAIILHTIRAWFTEFTARSSTNNTTSSVDSRSR